MSQTKVQLIAPIGVVTASTLETTGVLTATTFVGDIAGTVTGITSTTDNLNLGIVTATSFAGDFTGIGSGLTGTPNIVAGVVTATKFIGNTPGTVSGLADGTNINAGIITATSFLGNLTGNAAGLSTTTAQLTLGIVTATSYSGSGANLSGVSAGPVGQQAVTANSGTTTIDLSSGNVIYMTQSANTTVAFANTEGNTDVVYLIRIKDDNTTTRTLTWPSGFVWNGGTEPTLLQKSGGVALKGQTFKLTTRDNGATWYGVEVVNYDTKVPYELWSMGWNSSGIMGTNAPGSRWSSPVQVPGTTWASIESHGANGGAHMVQTKSDSTLWAWGYNDKGQLGQNNGTTYSSPIQIPGTTWAESSSNGSMTLATKTDGTLYMWGNNSSGGLGQNDRTQRSSPVQIGSGTDWGISEGHISVADSNRAAAIKNDGTLWTWGLNEYGQLGQNNKTYYSSPTQIPGTTWSKIDLGYHSGAGLKTDGTLWSWGMNNNGMLGQNQPGNSRYSSPVQVPGTTWKHITFSYYDLLATKTDGTLWAWGSNAYGQLGQNNLIPVSSPVQIPGTTWSIVGGAGAATKTDGTLWTWGENAPGKLGHNNRIHRSSPTQVPGTSWADVKVHNKVIFANKSLS